MIKRAFDVSFVVLTSPLWATALIVLLVMTRRRLGSPVLFRQVRPGRHGRPFTLIKLRTMTDARDATGELLPDAERLTAYGGWLRSTSLDELPEFWNVLTGDMSLVGPRPLLVEYLPLYDATQARRHLVRPGITGWAQINGRNALGWPERFTLDVWYVDHRTFWLDMRILALTLVRLVQRRGVSAPGEATMSRFAGTGGAR